MRYIFKNKRIYIFINSQKFTLVAYISINKINKIIYGVKIKLINK